MLTIVIPALNEDLAIEDTVRRALAVASGAGLQPCEVIVVDDGSRDRTPGIAAAAGARVISHPHNAGYGASLKTGIAGATYDMVAITDADGTYPIEEIPRLVERYRKGFDMVVGARTGEHYRESSVKSPLRWVLRQLVEFTSGRSIPDINSGLRVFSKATISTYFPHLCNTFSFTTSATLAYMMTGRFVDYQDIDYYERKGTTKVRLLRDALRTLQYIVEAITYYNPTKAFLMLSGACVAVGGASGVTGLWTGSPALLATGFAGLLAAIAVFGMGLVAVLLKQIMNKS